MIAWLRALARSEHARAGGPGVGAVGMCFTGGFALAMAAEPCLLAPVLSQPSLPFGDHEEVEARDRHLDRGPRHREGSLRGRRPHRARPALQGRSLRPEGTVRVPARAARRRLRLRRARRRARQPRRRDEPALRPDRTSHRRTRPTHQATPSTRSSTCSARACSRPADGVRRAHRADGRRSGGSSRKTSPPSAYVEGRCRCSRRVCQLPRTALARSAASRTSCSAVSIGVRVEVSNHQPTSPSSRRMSVSSRR